MKIRKLKNFNSRVARVEPQQTVSVVVALAEVYALLVLLFNNLDFDPNNTLDYIANFRPTSVSKRFTDVPESNIQ